MNVTQRLNQLLAWIDCSPEEMADVVRANMRVFVEAAKASISCYATPYDRDKCAKEAIDNANALEHECLAALFREAVEQARRELQEELAATMKRQYSSVQEPSMEPNSEFQE